MWSAEDREKALRWEQRERERCSDCGFRTAEWLDDEGEIDLGAWSVQGSYCPGCAARDTAPQLEKAPGVRQRWVRSAALHGVADEGGEHG